MRRSIVAPGSVHPKTGKLYKVENEGPIADAPEWLKQFVLSESEPTAKQHRQKHSPVPECSIKLETADVDALPLPSDIRSLIHEGKPKGQRSEAIMSVLYALAKSGLKDGQILYIFEKYSIGEKYLEKGGARQRWIMPQLEKARQRISARKPKDDIFQKMRENPELERQADALLEEVLNKSVNGIKHGELTTKAFNILIRNLVNYGNIPGKEHKAALLEVIKAYTDMAQGVIQGRFAFPLATGMGKTQSIVAWVAALYELGITHISLAVCASKVEALCDLKRDLIKQGIPEDVIGLFHSYKFSQNHAERHLEDGSELPEGFASLPSTDNHQEKQILLITHNRVRGKGSFEEFHLFKGKPRDLLIWDESLFISDNRSVSEVEVKSALGWWKPRISQNAEKLEVLDYLEQCVDILNTELEALKQADRLPEKIQLPSLTPDLLKKYKATVGGTANLAALHAFLDISHSDLRVVNTPQRGGFVTYDIAVPPELKNIIILDASHNIRELVQYDKTIRNTSRFSDNVVSYEQVTVHQLYQASGRSRMTDDFRQTKPLVAQEVAEVVKGIPMAQGIILFTFKEKKGVNFKDVLMRDLEACGIDVNATVRVPVWSDEGWKEQEKPRFVWLTWGQETSLSQFKYCSNVIFAGVLHRSHVDLASCIVGQQDDFQAVVSNSEIQRVERSEIAHCLYQAMSRGSCRVLENSKAKPMNVWLIHKDKAIETWIKCVMPGIHWDIWRSVHLLSQREEDKLCNTIMDHLDSLPDSETRISTSKIKKSIDLDSRLSRTFSRTVKKISDEARGWELEGRSLVRVTEAVNS